MEATCAVCGKRFLFTGAGCLHGSKVIPEHRVSVYAETGRPGRRPIVQGPRCDGSGRAAA